MSTASRPERVWYVAYGSNLCEARFLRYIRGGPPESGARDTTAPRRSVFTRAALELRFAHQSVRWNGGGVAFVDPADPGDPHRTTRAHVRAWDLTVEQFEDVFAQENRLDIPTPLPWDELLQNGEAAVGSGWYRRLLSLSIADLDIPDLDTQPVITFTWPSPVPHNAPDPDYLATIRRGLSEGGLDASAIGEYLPAAVEQPDQQPDSS